MKKIAFILIFVLLTLGCSTAPPTQVLTNINSYYYYSDRFTDRCPSYDTKDCPELIPQRDVLLEWNKLIKQANDAVNRGGELPLQLKSLKEVEKKFRKGVRNGW